MSRFGYNVRMWNVTLPFKDTDKIGVAVSGGRDSMALLHYLLSRVDKSQIVVINIEHGIRGDKSKADSLFVQQYADKMDIEAIMIEVDTLKHCLDNKLTIEQAARDLRFLEFDKLIEQKVVDKIALAHHKGDQCETILMRILRGTGINGLQGIQVSRDDKYIRPLIDISRNEIDEYIEANSIPYVEDETNEDNDYTRNFIRNEVLPLIETRYPDYENAFVRLSRNASEDNDCIMQMVEQPQVEDNKSMISISNLDKHRSIVTREIMLCMNAIGVTADIERKHIDSIINIKNLRNGDSLDLPHKVKVYREYDKVVFTRLMVEKIQEKVEFDIGLHQFNGKIVEIAEYKGEGLRFDIDKIPKGSVIRLREQGDYIHKFGGGRKSLGDYMTDLKIPRRLRDSLPVIANEDEILILADYQISKKIAVDNSTKKEYTINIRSI